MRKVPREKSSDASTGGPVRVALVTGAASPLGEAICRKLSSRGMKLAVHYRRSRSKALRLRDRLRRSGMGAEVFQAELGKTSDVKRLVGEVCGRWGRLDLLVNNASLFSPDPARRIDLQPWRSHFNTNLLAPYCLTILAEPWLQKTGGSVVNITDIYGESAFLPGYAAYSVSKSALVFLTKYLALSLAPHIRVNAVSPGVISFPKTHSQAQKEKLIRKTALGRKGNPEDIAEAVWFLASQTFVTGQVLRVDGGRFMP
jgi:pteridine reductase